MQLMWHVSMGSRATQEDRYVCINFSRYDVCIVWKPFARPNVTCHSPSLVKLKKNLLSLTVTAGPFGSGCRFPAVWQLSFCLFINSAAFKQGSTMSEPPMRPLWRPLQRQGCAPTPCHAETWRLDRGSNMAARHATGPFKTQS